MWKCNDCDLLNHDTNAKCIACFADSVNRSPLQILKDKQDKRFNDYIEQNIAPYFKECPIPTDIITLCHQFYVIDVEFISNKDSTQHSNALDQLGIKCCKRANLSVV